MAALIALIVTVNLLEKAYRNQEPPDRNNQAEEDTDAAVMRSLMIERDIPEMEIGDSGLEAVLRGLKRKKFIRDVLYEKDEVCLDEGLEIRVDLQNPDGPESDLICRIGGKFGDRVIINFNEPGEETIAIYVKDPEGAIDMKNIKFKVTACPGKASVVLKAAHSQKRADEAELSIVKKRGITCPCTYEWNFGDGVILRTGDENVSHYYGNREQSAYSSTFIVTADVLDNTHARARGRTSITFSNILWASKQAGFSIVPIVQEPAPGPGGNNNEIPVKIKNIYENPILFDTATIHATDCTDEEKSYTETVKAGALMKKTEVKAGEIADDTFVLPQGSMPESACGITIML